jgi:hypothetical protein
MGWFWMGGCVRRRPTVRGAVSGSGGGSSLLSAEYGAVGPRHLRARVGAAQYGDFVPQREDLGVLRGVGAGEQRHPVQHAYEQQVDESEGHGERSCWAFTGGGDAEVEPPKVRLAASRAGREQEVGAPFGAEVARFGNEPQHDGRVLQVLHRTVRSDKMPIPSHRQRFTARHAPQPVLCESVDVDDATPD